MSSLDHVSARIEELLDGLGDGPESAATEEAVRLLVELYGEGLSRLVEFMAGTEAGRAQLREAAGDELVASLLIVHGLHPVPLEERISTALDSVRPYLGSHAGGVEVVEVGDDGVLRLRLQGNCDGCSASSETVRVAIENAVLVAAPEIVSVEAEGMVEHPRRTQLLQIQPYPPDQPSVAGWQELADPPPLSPGELAAVELAGLSVLLARTDEQRYAYRNRCAACDSALERAVLSGTLLRCAGCGTAYDLAAAGRPVDGQGDQLDPLPLIADARGVRIAIPEPART